ncbi:hypothetical protein D9M71_283240 [compost metagenome]
MLDRRFDKGDIQAELAERLENIAAVCDLQMQAAVRQFGKETSHHPRQQIAADAAAGPEVQLYRRVVEQRLQLRTLRQQRAGLGVQRAAVVVQRQALAATVEQARAEGALQLLQRLAGGGLGKRDGGGSLGDIAVLGNGSEGRQLAKGDAWRHIDKTGRFNKNNPFLH